MATLHRGELVLVSANFEQNPPVSRFLDHEISSAFIIRSLVELCHIISEEWLVTLKRYVP